MILRPIRVASHVAYVVAILGLLVTCASADPKNGERLAQRWCAACHLVAADQRQASADVPPFATIARRPGFNVEKLANFLLEPHPKMPPMALSRREATDIAEYIAGLAPAQ
jgi:mono/diheme cytochrome c family protein